MSDQPRTLSIYSINSVCPHVCPHRFIADLKHFHARVHPARQSLFARHVEDDQFGTGRLLEF